MEVQENKKQVLQWHPAFYAGIQIEFQKEAQNLIFENEHQLGTKPKEIDVLIIKKEKGIPIQTNIGKIFRKHNIVEYKSPKDYLNIDDFYKVYGYACFYKSDSERVNGIDIGDITLTFVCYSCPKALIENWEQDRKYKVVQQEEGIYYIYGDRLPMQLILTSQLSIEKNFWLRNLTDNITKSEEVDRLVTEYEKYKDRGLYKSVMDIIVRANREVFEEEKSMCMCDALMELFKDELEEGKKQAIQEGLQEGRQQGLEQGLQQGLQEGILEGVRVLVETCQELKLTKKETMLRIKEKFSLEEENATDAVKKYWK